MSSYTRLAATYAKVKRMLVKEIDLEQVPSFKIVPHVSNWLGTRTPPNGYKQRLIQ